jgi:hypothetical protein
MSFPYAGYEEYKQAGGKLTQDEFKSQIVPASAFLRYFTLRKSEGNLSDSQRQALMLAACRIADLRAGAVAEATDEEGHLRSGTLASETNDGYSVSWTQGRESSETLEESLARRSAEIARIYLAGTGLLSRKAGCCR